MLASARIDERCGPEATAWEGTPAYLEAQREIEERRAEWQRLSEVEQQAALQSVFDEAKRRKEAREYREHLRWRADVEARYKASWKKYPTTNARLTKAFEMRRDGMTLQQIGDEIGVSRERIRQMLATANRQMQKTKRRLHPRAMLARITEPERDAPRDVWLTYYPSADPRLDNVKPVTLADF